jgi:hypothetical protein
MQYGICIQATVPVRETFSDKSQMINQLLFGDLFFIKEHHKGWALIETVDDQYEGWIDVKQVTGVTENWFDKTLKAEKIFVDDICSKVISSNGASIPVTLGATLPFYENKSFRIGNENYQYEGAVARQAVVASGEGVISTAKKYLEASYLWGGRSPFGLDCSGFTQIVFKMNGILLPRDASLQVNLGEEVNFIEEAIEGDLAFFGDEEGSITHTGILLGKDKVIHASGKVRIDKIDHHGIFNKETGEYTHTLRVIKRIFSS